MEGPGNDNVKSDPDMSRGYEPNGPTLEPVQLTAEEYTMLVNFRNQRVASGTRPSQIPLPPSPKSVPSAPGYSTITIPDALAASIFGQIKHREMQAR